MSSRDSFDGSLASPLRARSLFTVRAAISSAVSSDSPRSSAEPFAERRNTVGKVSAGATRGNYGSVERREEATMYIGGGVLALIVIIVLLIWLL